MRKSTKILGWICLACWLAAAVGESIMCGMGKPLAALELSWVDILLRDWCLVVFCITKLFDEYF